MPHRVLRALPRPARHQRADATLALALALASVLQVLWLLPIADSAVGLLVALVSTLPLAWRRRRPVAAALVGSAIWLVPTDGYIVLGFIAAYVLFYSVGAYVADSRRVVAVAAAGLAFGLAGAALRDEPIGEYLGAAIAALVPPAVGRFVRRQRAQSERLERLTRHLERERERSAQAAVTEERARIARELHDVVSHGVSLIAVQAEAAGGALDRDPELARAPIATIRRSAREAMTEMRRLLGVLRDDGEDPELVPLPGLAQLPALVDRLRAAGLPVELRVQGSPRRLPASLDLSAYRIVQEALTNVRKHARGAPTTVSVAWLADALSLHVADQGPGPPVDMAERDGHGLVGMRERARVHGGTLTAGPGPQGGFEVSARLPLGGDER